METKIQNLKIIPINIWDDYYDDEHVPEGEKQETYVYIEENDCLAKTEKEEILTQLLSYIEKNIKLNGVKFSLKWETDMDRHEISIENITHVQREELVEILQKANLFYHDIPFEIYSES